MKPWGDLEIYSPEDELDADEYDEEPLDLSGVWRRPASEYQRGATKLELCSIMEARFTHLRADRDFDSKISFRTGVRGNEYHPDAYSNPHLRGEVWFELVPEPSNPHDPHAVAVDLNGVRAGYMGASMAPYYQWLVRAANSKGTYCIVPGFIESPSSSWMVLPTLEVAEGVLDSQGLMLRLRALWDSLPVTLRQQIESEYFHPTEETARQLWGFRRLDPALFPTHPDPDAYSVGWGRTFNAVRLERNERVAEERRIKREAAEAEKALRRTEREKATTRRDREIVRLAEDGLSNSEISRRLGVSHDTVRRGRGESGLKSQGGDNAYSTALQEQRVERCFEALALQEKGATRSQIAHELRVSPDSAKDLLSDGRFYQDPLSYPERLKLARQAHSEDWTSKQGKAVGASGLRATRDAKVLPKLGCADLLTAGT